MAGKQKQSILILAACVGIAGCGLVGDPADPGDIEKRTEVVLQPEEGLEGAVRIDSVAWRLTFFEFGFDEELQELEGAFLARFANLTEHPLQIRYELRFFDPDDVLIDFFFPFGQPVRLEPSQVLLVEGEFIIQADDSRDLERIATMRLVARVMRSD